MFVYALADKTTGRTIAWVHDPESNWQRDANGQSARTIAGAILSLPAANKKYRVQWWDTYKGEVIQQTDVSSDHNRLILPVPPVQRDIAVSIFSVAE